jgi:hypothetical protein
VNFKELAQVAEKVEGLNLHYTQKAIANMLAAVREICRESKNH